MRISRFSRGGHWFNLSTAHHFHYMLQDLESADSEIGRQLSTNPLYSFAATSAQIFRYRAMPPA
jgi:hypothetical protein